MKPELPFEGAPVKPFHVHPTPAHIMACIFDELHADTQAKLGAGDRPISVEVYQIIRKGIQRANQEHDMGVQS